MNEKSEIPELQVGDVGLVNGYSWLAKAIRFFMNLYRKAPGLNIRPLYNHAFILVDIWGTMFVAEALDIMKIKVTYRIILFLLPAVFIINSCSTSRDTPCPDFRDNKSYSSKYQAHYKVKPKYSKNQSLRYEISEYHLPYNLYNTNTHSADFTINPKPPVDSVVIKINAFQSVTPIQIHSINK